MHIFLQPCEWLPAVPSPVPGGAESQRAFLESPGAIPWTLTAHSHFPSKKLYACTFLTCKNKHLPTVKGIIPYPLKTSISLCIYHQIQSHVLLWFWMINYCPQCAHFLSMLDVRRFCKGGNGIRGSLCLYNNTKTPKLAYGSSEEIMGLKRSKISSSTVTDNCEQKWKALGISRPT